MKSIFKITIIILWCILGGSRVAANNYDLFNYNQKEIQAVVSDLSTLENFIEHNHTTHLEELQRIGTLMVNGLVINSNPFSLAGGEPPLGIPSFLWGCCFGVTGLIIVYIVTDNDKEEVKKALHGCAVTGAVIVVFYLIAISTSVSTAQSM